MRRQSEDRRSFISILYMTRITSNIGPRYILNVRSPTAVNSTEIFHTLTLRHPRQALLVAGGQVNTTDDTDTSEGQHPAGITTDALFGLCPHPRRLDGHHLDGWTCRAPQEARLGRRVSRAGIGCTSRLSDGSMVLSNRALSRGGII